SPIRSEHPPTQGVQAALKRLQKDNAICQVSPEEFFTNYLPAAFKVESWSDAQKLLVDSILTAKAGHEADLYTDSKPLIRLCNLVSKRVLDSLCNKQIALVFHSYYNKKLPLPLSEPLSPDIVVSYEPPKVLKDKLDTRFRDDLDSATRLSWFNIAAAGEAKVRNPKQERYQTGNYLRNHLQFRPELHSVIGFSADKLGYSLYYHDASVIHQCSVKWDDPSLLHAFVHRLYQGTTSDPSIVNLQPQDSDPSWLVKIEKELLIITTATPNLGLSQRRFTAIATDVETGGLWFIKDPYHDVKWRFNKGLLYAKAHKGKMLPGLMCANHYGHPLNASGKTLMTTNFGDGPNGPRIDRWKMRVATRGVGDSLSKTPTLLEFLKVMYDACVAQRNLHRRGILHRDINDHNIMMAPKDNGRYYKDCVDGYNDVKYVNQVLNPNQSPKPACLVIDLGHSANLDYLAAVSAESKNSKNFAERKGTPKFISRSVSKGELLDPFCIPSQMPKLDGRPRKLLTACTDSKYEAYNKAVDDGSQSPSKPAATRFTHQLFHDAESTFWVISWFLARSAPKDYEKESDPNPKLTRFINGMKSHYPSNETIDPRDSFSATLEAWKQILHPRLVDVAPMLSEMHEYILPEWGYRPELNTEYPEHAHEALMRLLLREIVRIEDDKTKDVVFAPLGTRHLLE
ncbi:unnamed protein product, partial [Rhizoctonia solani]